MEFEQVSIYTSLWIDHQLQIIGAQNINNKLIFGSNLQDLERIEITHLADNTDVRNKAQLGIILDAIHRANSEKRNVFLRYTSYLTDNQYAHISAHVIYIDPETVCLQAAEIDEYDLQRIREQEFGLMNQEQFSADNTPEASLQWKYENLYNQTMTILNSLPIGVEVYDPEGTLLFLNDMDCRIFNIDREVLMASPVNIHKNPNLPEEVKNAAKKGNKVCMHFPYNFVTVSKENYYPTTQDQTIQIKCNGTPVINANGQIENYVFIVEDVTEANRLEEEQRQNRRKTELSMKAANMMLWEFDNRTQLFFSDNDPINGYNPSKPLTIEDYNNSTHPDDRALSLHYIQKMINGEENSFDFEIRFKFPGSPHWQYCTISGTPYEEDASGRVIRYVGFRKNNSELQNKKILQDNILNSIPLPIHIKDIEDNFRYVFCNKESQRMFGSQEGQTIYDVWDESLVYTFRDSDLEVFHSGKPYFGEARIVLKDGREYDTIVRKSIIEDGGKRLLLSIYWDQAVQNELERRSKVLSLSMNALNAYTWEYDVAKDRFRYGEGFDTICPNSANINTHSKFAEYVHPDDRQMYVDSLKNIKNKDQGDFTLEYRVDLGGQGAYEWWECRGILETRLLNNVPYKYVFGMDVNINAHKKTEFALLTNKEELSKLIRQNELVLNNTNSGLAFITPDYIVQWENVSIGTTHFEYEAYKKGEPCYQSAHNRTEACEDCVLQKVMQTRKTERKKFKRDNGQTIEVYSTPVFNENDAIEGVVIRIDDITEREQIDELRQAKIVAEQSDKLKSTFLANMSHEIRTPLNAIIGFSNLLMATTDPEEKEEFIGIIENSNELLLKVINDILDLSKIEAGTVELKYEEFNLSEYFKSMATSMKQRMTNPDVRLIVLNNYSNCTVCLDKNRLGQIITNYVTNAIKYTVRGTIEMEYELTGAGIRLNVRDTGIGIPENKRNKVFQRFEKLDEFAQGTGLGLSICKAIADSMGGTVGFESEYGVGSLFWAELPCQVTALVQ